MQRPAYRGALCQASLAAIVTDEAHGAPALARVDPKHVEAIRTASKLAWIDAIALDEINTAYLEEVGEAAYLDFWRRYSVGAVDGTLFGSLFNGAIRIFGRTPAGLLKWVGRAWEVTTRDYATVTVESSPDVVRVHVRGLAPQCRRLSVALSTQASVAGIIELTQRVPLVTRDLGALERDGRYDIEARWSAGAEPDDTEPT